MNPAAITFNKIITLDNGFKGSVRIVTEDIVALMVNKRKGTQGERKIIDDDNTTDGDPKKRRKKELLKWVKHYKSPCGIKYKLGDTKEFDGHTYHYCDAPTHRYLIKWHDS